MTQSIKPLPQSFFGNIQNLSFQEIAYQVAECFFGEDVEADALRKIVYDTLSFDVPLVKVTDDLYSLELFHGPTLAFKENTPVNISVYASIQTFISISLGCVLRSGMAGS